MSWVDALILANIWLAVCIKDKVSRIVICATWVLVAIGMGFAV